MRILGAALCGALSLSASAATYKWLDEQGNPHYSDRIPPEQVQLKHFRLDEQGREVEIIEGAKGPERLKREQQLKRLRAETARLLGEQRNRDISLLRTYGSEAEMHLALNDQIGQMDASIHILEKYRGRHMENLRTQEKRAADLERQGQEVTASVLKAIEDERHQIVGYDDKIRSLEDKKRIITTHFTKDMERFRSLKAGMAQPGQSGLGEVLAPDDESESGSQAISAVACSTEAICAKAWDLARRYTIQKAGTALVTDADRIVQTASPQADQDIALTLARIAAHTEDMLFLDVRCRQSSLGQELCAGPRVREIRSGFKVFIEAGMGPAQTDSDADEKSR